MARNKQATVSIRTTERRDSILRTYAEMKEKSITAIIEDYIDNLEQEVKEHQVNQGQE